MAGQKKLFRETQIYPIVFMVLITIVFIGILATFYNITAQRVEDRNELKRKHAILTVFNLPTENIEETYEKFIVERREDEILCYEAYQDSVLIGYGFPIKGKGLWGTIEALIVVTPEFDKILNLKILSQNETPGLGGRITEEWFTTQFSGKPLILDEKIVHLSLVIENEDAGETQINQITGATASSMAVVDMLYNELRRISQTLGLKYE